MPDAIETIILQLDSSKLDQQTKRDLEANAQLKRLTPQQLLADIIKKRLGDAFTVRAA